MALEVGAQRQTQIRAISVQLVTPDFTLLLDKRVLFFPPDQLDMLMLDRLECERQAGVSEDLAFVHVLDACRHLDRQRRHVGWTECNFSSICTSLTLPPELHQCVLDSSFFTPLTNTKQRMTHLLSKAINIRCQRREFFEVVYDHITPNDKEMKAKKQRMEEANSERTATVTKKKKKKKKTAFTKQDDYDRCRQKEECNRYVRELLLCSLLGNYAHINPKSRPLGRARALLYDVILDPTHPLFMVWIERCPFLLINSFRDYMIDTMRYDPALYESLHSLMKFDQFTAIVNNTMDQIRGYIRDFAVIPSSALAIVMKRTVDGVAATATQLAMCTSRVVMDLEAVLQPSLQSILTISYRRPPLNSWQLLLGLRRQVPMMTMEDHRHVNDQTLRDLQKRDNGNNEEEEDADDEEDDEKRRCREEREFLKSLTMYGILNPNRKMSQRSVRKALIASSKSLLQLDTTKQKKQKLPPAVYTCRVNPKWFLTNDQFTALKEVVYRENPIRSLCLDRVVNWMHYFGIDEAPKAYMHDVFRHYHAGTLSLEKLKDRIDYLAMAEPHCYNLLQIAAQLVRDAQRHFFVVDLPAYILENQIKAAQARTKFQLKNVLYPSAVHFVFCSACNRVYSLLRAFANLKFQPYRFGWRDVVFEYSTNMMYCRRHKVTPRGRCDNQPLWQLNLLGKMLIFENKMIMICPQPNCGCMMELDPERCKFTEYGPACCDCTLKLDEYADDYKQLMISYGEREKKCALCPTELANFNACYMYPCDTFLCNKHHFPRFKLLIEEWHALQDPNELTQEKVVAKMADLKVQFKQARYERNKNYYKRQLALQKQRTRSKQRPGGSYH